MSAELPEPPQSRRPSGSPGRRLVLLRHGRTAWNASGRAQGHADVELDAVGHAQAAAAAPVVAALVPVALWCSDLARARQTCAYLEKETGLVATQDARLREFSVGARQGLTMAEFEARFPDEYASWARGDDRLRVLGAESRSDVERRMRRALAECLAVLQPGETGVVVTHGAALKVGLASQLGWSRDQAGSLRGMDNCAWAVLEEGAHGGRMRLASYNVSVR